MIINFSYENLKSLAVIGQISGKISLFFTQTMRPDKPQQVLFDQTDQTGFLMLLVISSRFLYFTHTHAHTHTHTHTQTVGCG